MEPVVYSTPNKAVVDAFDQRPVEEKVAAYWSDDKAADVRKQIKNHYIVEQQYRCCYCRFTINTNNNAVWDGEHVISRNKAAHFMFEPRNLAVACKDCNIAKSEHEVRVNPRRVTFPDKSEHYEIVHPHFDQYDQHIRWYGKVAKPLTPKGMRLIELCKLLRFPLLEAGVKLMPMNASYDDCVGKLMDPHATPLELTMALAAIGEYVKSVQQT